MQVCRDDIGASKEDKWFRIKGIFKKEVKNEENYFISDCSSNHEFPDM